MTDDETAPRTQRRPDGMPADLPLARGHLLLVGTGSFSSALLPSWALLLRSWYGCQLRACVTYSATGFVALDALAAATRSPVWGPDWNTRDGCVPHQELAEWADLVIVAPATANFVGKCANGISDSLALSVVTSTPAPVVIAPAVADQVVGKASMRRNLRLLAEDGYRVVPPATGVSLHNGGPTAGAMADLQTVLCAARDALPAAAPQAADPVPGADPRPVAAVAS